MGTRDDFPESTTVWLPGAEVRHQVEELALPHYTHVVQQAVNRYFADSIQQRGLDIQIAFVLVPDSVPLFEIQALPWIDDLTQDELTERLYALESPPVWQDPILVTTSLKIGTGCGWGQLQFDLPFLKILSPLPQGERIADFVRRYVAYEKCRLRQPGTRLRNWCWRQVETRLPANYIRWLPKTWKPHPATSFVPPKLPPLPATPPEEIDFPEFSTMSLEQIEELIRQFPNERKHHRERISVAVLALDHELVVTACRDALRFFPDDLWTQLRLAESLRMIDDSAAALKLLNEIIGTHPRFTQAYQHRSAIYASLGAFQEACRDVDYAVELLPRCAGLRRWRARLRAARLAYADALEDLTVARTLDPYHAETYGWRAFVRRQNDHQSTVESPNVQAAVADVEHALELDPTSLVAHLARADISLATGNPNEAIADCDMVLCRRPDLADALAYRGLAHLQLGHFAEAVADLAAALQKGSMFGFVGPMLIEAQHQLGDMNAALATADDLISQNGEYLPVLFRRQALLLELGHRQEALEAVNAIIELQPKLSQAYSERGNIYRSLDRWDEALGSYATALDLGNSDPNVKLNYALTLFDLRRFGESLVAFNEGIPELPNSPLGYFHRGRVHMELGRHDDAIADFTKVVSHDGELLDAYRLRAECHTRNRDFAAAIRDLDLLVEHDPSASSLFARGQAKILNGDFGAAELDVQEAIAREPGNTEAFRVYQHLIEARYYMAREDYDSAATAATSALEVDDGCLEAIRCRAVAYWYGNQLVEAIEDFSQVINIAGPSPNDLSGRGQVQAELGEYELALADLDEAISLVDDDGGAGIAYSLSGRGTALTGLQRYEEAAKAFEESIRRCPDNAWAQYHHGLLYLALGQIKAAAISFRLALQLQHPALRPRQRVRALAFLESNKDRN